MAHFLNVKHVKDLIHKKGKRCEKGFILALDCAVQKTIECAADQHNGGKKTLDAFILGMSKHKLK